MKLEKKTLIGIFIAAIMILSVLGFALSYQPGGGETLKYNDYKFVRTSQGLQTKINNQRTTFLYYPGQLTDIPFDENAKTMLRENIAFWFTYDPNSTSAPEIEDAFYYIEDKLVTLKDQYIQRGLTRPEGFSLPEITCANATPTIPVLVIERGNATAVQAQDSCIIATATTSHDVYRIADTLLYRALGVME